MLDMIFSLSIVVFNILIAFLVLIRSPKNKINILFFLMSVFIALWIATLSLYYLPLSNELILFIGRLNFVAIIFVVLFLFRFIYYFPQKYSKIQISKRLGGALYAVTVLLAIFTQFTPLIVSKEEVIGASRETIFGPLFSAFLLYFAFMLAISLYLFVKKFILTKGQTRTQLLYLAYGIMIPAIIASITNLILPLVWNYNALVRFGPVSTVILVSLSTYAIVKHRLMDIRFVVAKSLSYAALLLIIAALYATGVLALERVIFPGATNAISIYQGIFRVALTAIIAFSFQPIRRWVGKKTDKIFFKSQYNSEELLSTLTHVLSSSIILIELLYKVTDILSKDMKISRSLFVLLENENKIYTSQANGYKEEFDINPKDISILANEDMLALSELEYNSRLKNLLNKYDAELSIPLKTDKGLLGVWLLGEKNSGEAYSQQDYQVFEIVMPEIAVAIENAKAYEEINAFNKTLRNEINRATHKLAEKNSELLESGQQLEDLVNFLPDATFAIDANGKIIIWNKSMEELTGVNADKMIGEGGGKVTEIFYGDKSKLTLAEKILKQDFNNKDYYKGVRVEGDFLHIEVYFPHLNGKRMYLGVKAAPLYDQDRNIMGAIESLRDISEIKQVEKILRKNNEELRRIDLAKDDFISMASHQLRTPITAIKGYLSMLIEGDAGEVKISQYDFILEAYRASNRMTGLVNDLLNVSRMEAGRFYLEINDVNLNTVIEEEIKQLEGSVREHGLYIKFKKDKQVPAISADKTKVRQVIMNFIDNAIYYTKTGGITVDLHKEGEYVVFTVTDTGMGVPKASQPRLFQKFYRADNAKNTRPDGTGLGLFLARKVIESHSGKIIFHSVEGNGSTFGFKLPIKNMAKKFSVVMPDVSSPSDTISQDVLKQNVDLVKK